MSDLLTLDKVRNAIEVLNTDDATSDDALTALAFIGRLKELTRELNASVEQGVMEWIIRNGDLVDGEIRYYIGPEKKTKCNSNRQTLEAVLESVGGDMDAMAECLASDAFKPGACRTILGDSFEQHFTTTTKDDLKTGKPVRKLQRVDQKFIR
jgi:hypothetical protein